jgi:hypothetical protein
MFLINKQTLDMLDKILKTFRQTKNLAYFLRKPFLRKRTIFCFVKFNLLLLLVPHLTQITFIYLVYTQCSEYGLYF